VTVCSNMGIFYLIALRCVQGSCSLRSEHDREIHHQLNDAFANRGVKLQEIFSPADGRIDQRLENGIEQIPEVQGFKLKSVAIDVRACRGNLIVQIPIQRPNFQNHQVPASVGPSSDRVITTRTGHSCITKNFN
jgi:hypothetical protein